MKDEYDKYISSKVCKECNGMRLNNTALSIKVDNDNIGKNFKPINWLTFKLD